MDGVSKAHNNSGLLTNLCLTTKWTGRAKVPLKARVLKGYSFYISATLDARQTMRT
jgi:hypothetical protein